MPVPASRGAISAREGGAKIHRAREAVVRNITNRNARLASDCDVYAEIRDWKEFF
jgi:hypothetical protein